ncbi:DNA cytosine methyltransferase [uncultured Herbaspirillum sp.]|uniref:DNA cytosine methyltransferase n=1 Tax=uncultured Herbaspirillum sp. TaxID=160236 RepID=UPI00259044CE|nr:DNA cytosine methyltransferase [uncultured Herbaspirillum sp.]
MNAPRFIDVFAGCGGLSLGLLEAGFNGLFAVEKSPLAFETLKHNLIAGNHHNFSWPTWLPKEAMTCESLITKFSNQLGELADTVDLIVGGPPCQGFSTAGKRNAGDPRNKMTEQYLALVGLVQPTFIVIENVAGYDMSFDNKKGFSTLIKKSNKRSYAEYISSRLTDMGYTVSSALVNCADFGVPQNRLRFIIMCERNRPGAVNPNLVQMLQDSRAEFLQSKGLPKTKHVSVGNAISDLETKGRSLIPNTDSPATGFYESEYRVNQKLTAFQKLMRISCPDTLPNSRRLANHKKATIERFKLIASIARPGKCLSASERKKIGTCKHSITMLSRNMPAPTVTTLPDDILHYSEPRILTVRENARIQSFPDWFEFMGKYTTGGKNRKNECPRYTQVGNAVPPLLAEAIGLVIAARREALTTVDPEQAGTVAPNTMH